MGASSTGCVVRDSDDKIIAIHRQPIHDCDPVYAEAYSVLEALQLATSLNLRYIILEGDNLFVINAIKHIWHVTWLIITVLQDIDSLIRAFAGVRTTHYYRECNQLAHLVAAHSTTKDDIN